MKELLYLKDKQIKDLIEQIFYVYRETFADSKKILKEHSLGIAHQKVIHLVGKYEGITVSALQRKLKVTKQSLNRVLKDLIKLKAIKYKKDETDTRVKHVFLTEEGIRLFDEIFLTQKKRIYNAFLNSDSRDVISFDKVLRKIINEKF